MYICNVIKNKEIMKQTAVEWLIEQMNSQKGMLFEYDIKQAKEMEKQQIDDAFNKGFNKGYYDPNFDNDED